MTTRLCGCLTRAHLETDSTGSATATALAPIAEKKVPRLRHTLSQLRAYWKDLYHSQTQPSRPRAPAEKILTRFTTAGASRPLTGKICAPPAHSRHRLWHTGKLFSHSNGSRTSVPKNGGCIFPRRGKMAPCQYWHAFSLNPIAMTPQPPADIPLEPAEIALRLPCALSHATQHSRPCAGADTAEPRIAVATAPPAVRSQLARQLAIFAPLLTFFNRHLIKSPAPGRRRRTVFPKHARHATHASHPRH